MLTNKLALDIHKSNVIAGWWTDLETGLPKERCHSEMKMLQITELSEAMEGYRKNSMDDKLPQYKMLDVELVDCMIRQLDVIGYLLVKNSQFVIENYITSLQEDYEKQTENVPVMLFNLTGSIVLTDYPADQKDSVHHLVSCVSALYDVYEVALSLGVNIKEVMNAKRKFNASRLDHKIENRRAPEGKKC